LAEAPLTKCPACGKKKYEKQLTAAGFHLKGSGWYATDFKGGKKPDAVKTESTADAKTETKAEAKTATETEAKTETKKEARAEKKAPASTTN
jgi:predicted nucleic acid-binding Zn ribbon protein